MSKENDLLLKTTDAGGVYAREEIIKVVASVATKGVAGVSGLTGKLIDVFGNRKRGVEVKSDNGSVRLEIALDVIYGFKIPEIGVNVQTAVREALAEHLELLNVQVDVVVKGILVQESGDESEE